MPQHHPPSHSTATIWGRGGRSTVGRKGSPICIAFTPVWSLAGRLASRPFVYTVLVGKQDSILTNSFLPDHRRKPTNKTPFRLLVHFQGREEGFCWHEMEHKDCGLVYVLKNSD